MAETERQELCGTLLDGRYQLHGRIGLGGTGVVFEGLCLRTGNAIAVKTLRPCFVGHRDLGNRLRREAEVARLVAHPGIVPVLDDGVLPDGSPYIVMPRMYGESLSRLLLRVGRLPAEPLAAMMSRVAAILHSAHGFGYIHRDVKPEHVLLNRSPTGDLIVHLLDFGVCASATAPAEERQRESGKVFGTPTYVSPEQASGQPDVDGRADLFSLGIVMFESLTGEVPFSGTTVAKLLLRIIREDAPQVSDLRPGLHPDFAAIVMSLLAREPSERIPSARALSRALAPHLGDRKITERNIAAMLNVHSQVADSAPTARLPLPKDRLVA